MTILIIIRILKDSKYNMSCKHIYEEYYFIHIYEELISGSVFMKGFLNLTDEAIGVHKSKKKVRNTDIKQAFFAPDFKW